MIDYHMHTDYSVDAKGKVEDYCKSADEKKIEEICFTNHFILLYLRYGISPEKIENYLKDVESAKKKFKVKIKAGLEIDYWKENHKEIEKILDAHQLDFRLGTVHYIDGFGISGTKKEAWEFFKNKNLVEIYKAFFARTVETVESGLFDALAHPDYIRKNVFKCFGKELPFEKYRKFVEQVVEALVDNKVGIEINASGYYHGLNDSFPSSDFLKLCLESGVKVITVGSDSHVPSTIGRNFEEAFDKLRKNGCKKIFSFDKRKPKGIDIKSL